MWIEIARSIDIFAMAFALGATAWFFFVQSPVLLKRMGRERFVPLQMRLTVVLFKALSITLVLMLAASLLHSAPLSTTVITAAVAALGGLLNAQIIVPRALRSGGQSRREIKGKDKEASVADFAYDGAGKTTQFWHRAVVLCVVIMLAGLFPHGVSLVTL